ncbi:unnamed protein product [Cuscuta campestris]|uniref:Uncharacterized protein n=1 Tax=Cuscuta campestris TaxID=132261 RepID=A0A484NEV0_9ASTE|nr:unnamed protein product [Cuscuta campestris]
MGDDGSTDRLATLCSTFDCSAVEINGIPADQCGRSFVIKIPVGLNFYFWCSEKSKLLGDEMLRKMKDLLEKKPSLAELTGISESRLKRFAIHLWAHLVGSTIPTFDSSIDDSAASDRSESDQRTIQHHSSLSARSGSFKDTFLRNSLRNGSKERLKRLGDSSIVQPPNTQEPSEEGEDKPSSNNAMFQLLCSDSPCYTPGHMVQSNQSLGGSPYYCWCPPVSSLQYSLGIPHLPILSTEPLSFPAVFPPLSTAKAKLPLNFSSVSSLDLPPLLPDPLLRLPISQQIPTFTPLMCDPIVHIPFIDVCSSGGQGYLVSAGPGMSTAIPQAESVGDKSARETLRLLMSSSNPSNSPLMSVLPSFLPGNDEKMLSMLGSGTRGLYSSGGTLDIGVREFGGGKFVFEKTTEMASTSCGYCLDDDDGNDDDETSRDDML